MCQCSLNTFDSCPTGKFRVRVRTEGVKDQVAMSETRPTLSLSPRACLTGRRKERKNEKDRHGEKRRRVNMTGRKKERERRGCKVTKQALRRTEFNNTFATAALHCVEIIHVESPKALHASYLCVGLLSNKSGAG